MYPRWLWKTCSLPGLAWLCIFFAVPFYVVVCIAFGKVNPIFQTPIPVWNPLHWDFTAAWQTLLGFLPGQVYLSVFLRTVGYVAGAVGASLLVAYPVAYYISRHAKRTKMLLLILLVSPFCVSYLMRMLAWVGLLAPNGLLNDLLMWTGLSAHPPNWLGGHASTVIFALAYGYLPYMVLPLIAALDRIDQRLLEASKDLGLTASQTFFRVTLPMSKIGVLSSCAIVTLPMFGDYFTTTMVSGTASTSMLGNQIYLYFHGGPHPSVGATLTLVLSVFLALLMAYYLYSVARQSKAGY